MGKRPILVHEIADARAALRAAAALGVPVTLMSAPSGAAALGPGWWGALVSRIRDEFPQVDCIAVLDCGGRADLAQAGMRIGLADLCYRGPATIARKLRDIARQQGATLHGSMPCPLDLAGVADREAACRAWLSKSGRRPATG